MLSREALAPVGIGVETERRPSVGVALVIVGIDSSRNGENVASPKLWTIIERETNFAKEKIAGQISFPGETSKTEESLNQNIFGALAGEFSGDDQRINNLWYVPGYSHIEGKVLIGSRPADLVVLIYTGSLKDPNVPLAINEVSPYGWVTLQELLKEHPGKIRKFARQIVASESSERVIGRAVATFSHSPLSRIPLSSLVPSNFSSMIQFYRDRERKEDIRVSRIS